MPADMKGFFKFSMTDSELFQNFNVVPLYFIILCLTVDVQIFKYTHMAGLTRVLQ